MPGLQCPTVILFLTALLMGIQTAAAQDITTKAPPPTTTGASPIGPELCPDFSNYNITVNLSATEFNSKLANCVLKSKDFRKNLTTEAIIPVELYENLANNSLLELSSLLDAKHNDTLTKIITCVRTNSGKDFKEQTAREHFGFNGTQYLRFSYDNCLKSMETRDCIEGVYFENVKDAETKLHKDAFMSSFNILSDYCDIPLSNMERGAGYYVLPSLSLVLGVALMVTKLAIIN